LIDSGIDTLAVGLETVAGPRVLAALCKDHVARIVFSLDLRQGVPISDVGEWRNSNPRDIADQAIQHGARRILLLDVARVGMSAGTGTDVLARELIAAYPDVEVAVGGGVRDAMDLHRFKEMGVHAALVASALHDGRIGREDLRRLE
jgi:phosphoribosylformimino-5-aminoimidazole carboxamide ribotide isomerase